MSVSALPTKPPHTLSVAPMLDWTDRHCRSFHRLITRHTLLYTEMVTTGAVLHKEERHLAFSLPENPVALQLGGNDPVALAECARRAEGYGYTEVNLNVGCPSDRVQNGSFGACLMATPDVVARGVEAMRGATSLPVTVKHRIGIDDLDSYEHLTRFVGTVASAGCETFIVHARKAWLKGLSPKENREIPPLRYEVVEQLKRDFPHLTLVINGGIKTLDAAEEHLRALDGVMIGREAYTNPYLLALADARLFGDVHLVPTRREIVEGLIEYAGRMLAQDVYLSRITKHTLGLFAGQPGARGWKRTISERAHLPGSGVEVIRDAAAHIADHVLDARPDPLAAPELVR